MKKIAILYFIVIGFSAFMFNTINVKTIKEHFSISGATEYNELLHQRDLIMFADPATGKIPDNFRQRELQFYKDNIAPNNKGIRGGAPWQNAGPWNVGGRTRAIAIDATNENNLIAGGVSGGIWRSTNGGASWQQSSNLNGYLGVTSICQDKRAGKQNIWYACTGEGSGNSASASGAYFFGDGLFKSIDSGASWQPIASTSGATPSSFSDPLQVSWRIVTHPSVDSDYIFVANYGCIYKSNDGGATWKVTLGNFGSANDAYYTDICVTTTGDLYATVSSDGNGAGYWRSTDKGVTWANITPANFTSHDRTVMGINPKNENQVYFFSYIPDSTNIWATKTSNYKGSPEWISLIKYTYVSGDGTGVGGTWQKLSDNLPNNVNATSGSFDKLNCQGGYDMFVKVQPTTGYVFIGGTNIFRSTDSFTTPNNFTQIGGYKLGTSLPHFEIWANHHPDNHDLLFYPSDYKKILSASDGGVRMAVDGNSTSTMVWTTLNNGYLTSQVYTVSLDPTTGSNYMLAGFQDNGNFITSDYTTPSQIWKLSFNGDGAYNYIAPNRAFYVMSIQEGKVAKFTLDNAGNPTAFSRIDPIGPTDKDYLFVNPFVVDPNDNNILYLPAGKSLWRQNQLTTLPLNGNWDSISTGWFKLTDTIKTSNTSNGYPAQITAIAVSKNPANTVYIGTSVNDVYRIDNANTGNPSLTKINKNNMIGYCSGIAIDPDDSKKVIVSYSNYSSNGLFYTASGGDTFKNCRGNLRLSTSNYSGVNPSMRCVAIAKTTEGKRKYYLGTSVGLYSTDTLYANTIINKDTTKWIQESPQAIGTNVVTSIDMRPADGLVAVGTHGGGVFYSKQFFPLAIPTVQNNTSTINIYPNPAINNCNINIQINQATKLNIYIVDILGKIYTTPINTQLEAGNYTLPIATNTLSNGQYFIVIQNQNNTKIVKPLLIAKQ